MEVTPAAFYNESRYSDVRNRLIDEVKGVKEVSPHVMEYGASQGLLFNEEELRTPYSG